MSKLLICLLLVMATTLSAKENSIGSTGEAATLIQLLTNVSKASDTELAVETKALQSAIREMSPTLPVYDKLSWMVEQTRLTPEGVRQSVNETLKMLKFKPRLSADLLEDYPELTPVGFIEVKEYPAIRVAKAKSFFPLFTYIKMNRIDMTSPVNMRYSQDRKGKWEQEEMAFLIPQDKGKLGRKGKVEVVDMPKHQVVSLGVNGKAEAKNISAASERLQAWLRASREKFEAAGQLRVLTYNAPGTREKDAYIEVQFPVRTVAMR